MKFRTEITAVVASMFIMLTLITPGLSQVVKESFEYTEGTLDAQGDATDGWGGPWIMSSGDVLVIDGNMAPDTDGKSIETVQSLGEELTFYRSLADQWPDNGEAYWIGFMFQRRDDGTLSSWGGLSLFLDDAELLFMGSPGLANRVGIECSGVSAAQNSEVSDMELSWVVVKLAMNGIAENDSVYLWVNPDSAQEPDITNADARGAFKGSGGFNRVRIGNDGGYILAYDMIRLGNSFDQISYVGTGVSTDKSSDVARTFGLLQNYPNPFNPATTISFRLPSQAFASLKVFNACGREVSNLLEKELPAGTHVQRWDAEGLPSGIYFYRLQVGSFTETKKLILQR